LRAEKSFLTLHQESELKQRIEELKKIEELKN
jgi:hypothetical protein